jgi:hypothetical protein
MIRALKGIVHEGRPVDETLAELGVQYNL